VGNIGERLARWAHMGLLVAGEEGARTLHYRAVILRDNFFELLGQLVLPVAREGRCLGDGQVLITTTDDLSVWL
jgi:hypothetical protein